MHTLLKQADDEIRIKSDINTAPTTMYRQGYIQGIKCMREYIEDWLMAPITTPTPDNIYTIRNARIGLFRCWVLQFEGTDVVGLGHHTKREAQRMCDLMNTAWKLGYYTGDLYGRYAN